MDRDFGRAPLFSFFGEFAGDMVADEEEEEQSRESSAQATFLLKKCFRTFTFSGPMYLHWLLGLRKIK